MFLGKDSVQLPWNPQNPGYQIQSSPPDELCIVVGFPREELELSPVQELMQAGERVLGDGALIHVIPHFHSHQGHSDI